MPILDAAVFFHATPPHPALSPEGARGTEAQGYRTLFPVLRGLTLLLLCLLGALSAHARPDIAVLQQSLQRGETAAVRAQLEAELQKDPDNIYLLYNRAVAAYAAGDYENALVDLDLVENGRSKSLANKARFQKGNAEFRLGLAAQETDTEATIAHWKQSLESYEALLKEQPGDANARKNHDQIHKLLFDLLMKMAQENKKQGDDAQQPPEERINDLRAAMEQFHEAAQMEPQNQEAKQGEQESRDELAEMLAEEGTQKTLSNEMVQPAPNQPQVPQPNVAKVQEGVNMLEDAHTLKPQDPKISEQLEQGRQRLADALTLQARIYQSMERGTPRTDEKLAVLRMAMEALERALAEVPEHPEAKQVMEEVKKRLAEIHEEQGDQKMEQAPNEELEQQASDLSEALDHFQQAQELQPQKPGLQQKADKAQAQLEQALEKLGDQKMQSPGQESDGEQLQRLEGAEQALSQLMGMKPSPKTGQKLQQVGDQLGKLRGKMGLPDKDGEPGGKGNQPQPMETQPEDVDGMPLDAPPQLDKKGQKGPYRSPSMNRNLRDY